MATKMLTLLDSAGIGQDSTKNPKYPSNKFEFPPDRAFRKSTANTRLQQMKAEYLLWRPSHQQIQQYIAPTRGVFDTMPVQRAQMIDHKTLLDDYAAQCAEIMANGLTSGMTSPSMPWVKLELDIKRPLSWEEASWLEDAEDVVYMILKRSNIYTCLHHCHAELSSFATGCFIVAEDFEDIARGKSFTAGEYFLGIDNKGRVNSFGREFWMQVGSMVKEFGYENCSASVQMNFDYNRKDVWVRIQHLIEPNDNQIGELKDYRGMKWRSIYWDNADVGDKFLSCRGYRKFPVIAPRWETTSTDQVYGKGPGWKGLGNAKELQKAKYDKLTARDKHNNPPMIVDANVEGNASFIPGGITKTSANNVPNSGIRPAYQIQYDAANHQITRDEIREDLNRQFFVDLFKMLISRPDDKTMTAYEIAELQQERLMQIGPVLYNIEKGELDVLIDILWDIAVENGLIRPAPASIAGAPIKVVYVSILAQAMKALGIQSINRVIGFVASLGAISPAAVKQAWDNFDVDEMIREVNTKEGAPAKIMIDPKVRDQKRDAENKAIQKQNQAQMMAMTAKGMSDLGNVPMKQPDGETNAGEQMIKANIGGAK